jgi:hypothetical protein
VRGKNPSQFRGKSREGSYGRGRDGSRERNGGQCYYCHIFGHFEKYYNAKLCDMEQRGANIIVEETINEKLFI